MPQPVNVLAIGILLGLAFVALVTLTDYLELEDKKNSSQKADRKNVEMVFPKIQLPLPDIAKNFAEPVEKFHENGILIKEEKNEAKDIIVERGTREITNTRLFLKGNIIVKGNGRLLIKDSEIHFQQDHNTQYWLKASENTVVEFDNVKVFTNEKWMNFEYTENASAVFKNFTAWGTTPWNSAGGNTKFVIENSMVGMTLNENASVVAKESELFFELVFTNTSGTYVLPKGRVEKFGLQVKNENGVIKINATDGIFTDWGSTLDRDTNITFVDSSITIGLNTGSDWRQPNSVVKVSGLKTKKYGFYSLVFDSNHLRLINTSVRDWYPQAWNNASIEISDSDLADVQWNGGTSRIIVRRSNVFIATGRNNVTYEFFDSFIRDDVIAQDNSTIYLYNTKVGGSITELGNGRIFVDGKRLEK